jgi:hypothetical protein
VEAVLRLSFDAPIHSKLPEFELINSTQIPLEWQKGWIHGDFGAMTTPQSQTSGIGTFSCFRIWTGIVNRTIF